MPEHGDKKALLRTIPSVDEMLSLPETVGLVESYSRALVVRGIRQVLDRIRRQILSAEAALSETHTSREGILESLARLLEAAGQPRLRCLVNATGVIVHTNLGRSVLADTAVEQLNAVATGYSNLEFDLATGRRGSRYDHVAGILTELTGAESALVVNNNAAAVLLVLDTLAKGKEVIVSRGQLVEIGGSFRIPDVMTRSGAHLVEVGTTNRTHLADYERAIGANTAFLMKVHTSNFQVVGFTSEVSLSELVALGKRYDLPVVEDLGSGSLVDLSRFGLLKEPTVQDACAAGADVVTFSGDKLLGGPQAGIIVGREEFLLKIRQNPLNRALRIDKLTLAALEATLRLYRQGAIDQIPTLKLLTTPVSEINRKALRLYRRLKGVGKDRFTLRVIDTDSQVGGGALPVQKLPSRGVAVKPRDFSVARMEAEMRKLPRPIIGRIEQDTFILDMRTVDARDIPSIVEAITVIFGL